jgi:hypothetical protein
MINPFKDVNWKPERSDLQKFARSLVFGFPILATVMALVAHWRTGMWKPGFLWMAVIGCGIGLVLWLLPQIAKPFYLLWYFVACCIGIMASNLLVIAFFAVAVTPLGLLKRLFGRDPMARKADPAVASYWREAQKGVDPERYFRQF